MNITICFATWNYGYSIGNSGASYTVIKPAFTGVKPDYVIMKPSHSALRAGLSVFKPNYSGIKPNYRPDYISKPSYSGLRAGLNPTYLVERADRRLKSFAKSYKTNGKPFEIQPKAKKLMNGLSNLMKNSKIFVKKLDSHNGTVVKTYQIDDFNQIQR